MFTACENKGFHIEFANGFVVSVQWGPGNYCENRNDPYNSQDSRTFSSPDAEVAVWYRDQPMLSIDYYDTVKGCVTPGQVAVLLAAVSMADPNHIEELEAALQQFFAGDHLLVQKHQMTPCE